jgi:hypothetical protein
MKIKNVAILLPKNNSWYHELALILGDAFSTVGIDACSHCGELDAEAVYDFAKKNRVQLVFDMNRPRADLPLLSVDIIHICWVVDFNGRPISDFCGSDITYLFGPKWLEKVNGDGIYKWMAPGVCVRRYFPDSSSFEFNASFVGHIPKPWSKPEMARNISSSNHELCFGDLLDDWEKVLLENRKYLKVHDDYINLLSKFVESEFGVKLALDRSLEYDLTGRLVRLLNRRELLDRVISVVDLSIFGPTNWSEWPAYFHYYRNFLETSSEMRAVYASSKVNFHEGNNMHFRVLDCMASGGLIFVRKNEYDEKPGGIRNFFQPGKHYVEFDLDDLEDKYRFYSENVRLCEKIRGEAVNEVRNNHTWLHRVRQIILDISRL